MTKLEFIEILKNNDYDEETINYILSKNIKRILGRKNYELDKIIKILKVEEIEVRGCLSILAKGKSDEIEKIIKLLKLENINLNKLNDNKMNFLLHSKYEKIENLILLKKEHYTDKEIKIYFKLKYDVNKFYTKAEIEEICNNLKINVDRFLDIFKTKNEKFKNKLISNLNENKKLWIGKPYACTKEQLEINKEMILKICSIVSKNFAFRNKCLHLQKDLEGFVLDIIINKCGDIFYCFEEENYLFTVLYSYCLKYLYNYINLNTSQIIENINGEIDNDYEKIENQEILPDIDFDILERDVIEYMSYLLEFGITNYEEKIKNKYNLNNEEYNNIIEKVKIKIMNKR